MVLVDTVTPMRPAVRIFNCSGVEMGSFLWEKGALAGWGWSDEMELIMVEQGVMVGVLKICWMHWAERVMLISVWCICRMHVRLRSCHVCSPGATKCSLSKSDAA